MRLNKIIELLFLFHSFVLNENNAVIFLKLWINDILYQYEKEQQKKMF